MLAYLDHRRRELAPAYLPEVLVSVLAGCEAHLGKPVQLGFGQTDLDAPVDDGNRSRCDSLVAQNGLALLWEGRRVGRGQPCRFEVIRLRLAQLSS